MILNSKIILLNEHNNKTNLYCNGYFYGYNWIEYYPIYNKQNKTRLYLESPEITIDNLSNEEYCFYLLDEDGNKGEISYFLINNKQKHDYFEEILETYSEENRKIVNLYIYTDNYLKDLYKASLNKENDKRDFSELINAVVDNYNSYSYGIHDYQLKIEKKHLLQVSFIDAYDDYMFDIHIEKMVAEDNFEWILEKSYRKNKDFCFKAAEEGIYRAKIFLNNNLQNIVYYYNEGEEVNNLAYISILNAQENKETFANAFIPTYEEENFILSNLYYLNITNNIRLFPAPILSYINEKYYISYIQEALKFAKAAGIKIFLSGKPTDMIFNNNAKPFKWELKEENQIFDPQRIRMYKERYYFWVQDENGNRLSKAATFDFEHKDLTNYNILYNKVYWEKGNKFLLKDLKYNSLAWSEIKESSNKYLIIEDQIDFKDYIDNFIVDSLLDNKYGLLCKISFNDYINYKYKDITYMNKQIYKPLYNHHVIPSGDYVLKIVRYNDTITTEYINARNEAMEIRVNNDKAIKLSCIRLSDYAESDFVFYNNVEFPKAVYNKIEVETINGL
jgi:hypothetical protein